MRRATIRASTLTGFAETARSVGLDPLRMLDAVGIPREALSDPDIRISTGAMRDVLELCGRAAEDFALRMAERRTPSTMGPVALIAREQPTVRAVLEATNRHLSLHSDATTAPLEDAGDVTIVRIVQSWPTPGPDRQAAELAMGQLMQLLRRHLGSGWRPLSASFVHSPPKGLDTHRRVFGPDLAFNQDFNGLVCRREDIDRPNPLADPVMAREIERYIAGLGAPDEVGAAERVRAVVVRELASGRCTADLAASRLGVDLRTLQRQLAAANTSFGDIVQDTRMTLIPSLLEDGDRPLAEISERLGFSALSAFSRWHRTHYGVSPSVQRRQARSDAPR